MPEPWLAPPVHTVLGTEGSLLDSDVQELFRVEDLVACGLTNVTQLQCGAQTNFRVS